jgi:hypothetical protein
VGLHHHQKSLQLMIQRMIDGQRATQMREEKNELSDGQRPDSKVNALSNVIAEKNHKNSESVMLGGKDTPEPYSHKMPQNQSFQA